MACLQATERRASPARRSRRTRRRLDGEVPGHTLWANPRFFPGASRRQQAHRCRSDGPRAHVRGSLGRPGGQDIGKSLPMLKLPRVWHWQKGPSTPLSDPSVPPSSSWMSSAGAGFRGLAQDACLKHAGGIKVLETLRSVWDVLRVCTGSCGLSR